jgi:hypothetical protein
MPLDGEFTDLGEQMRFILKTAVITNTVDWFFKRENLSPHVMKQAKKYVNILERRNKLKRLIDEE